MVVHHRSESLPLSPPFNEPPTTEAPASPPPRKRRQPTFALPPTKSPTDNSFLHQQSLQHLPRPANNVQLPSHRAPVDPSPKPCPTTVPSHVFLYRPPTKLLPAIHCAVAISRLRRLARRSRLHPFLPPSLREDLTVYRLILSAIPHTYDPLTQTFPTRPTRLRGTPIFSIRFGTEDLATFTARMTRIIMDMPNRVADYVHDAILSAITALPEDPFLISGTLNNLAFKYFSNPSLRPQGIQLLERSISASDRCHKARANLAINLYNVLDGAGSNAGKRRAIVLMEEAISISPLPRYKIWLGHTLMSPDMGTLRNPARAKQLFEETTNDTMFAPAMTCLTKLLKFEHEGVPSDIRCEKLRRSVLNVKNGIESRPFVDHCDSYEYVEATLSEAKAQQSQIFLLVLGGGGRGKTSLVRSLKGMPFLSGYNPTQLAAVSWIQVHLGSRRIPRSQEELNDLACHQDSLTAILARLRQSNPPKLDQQMSFNSRTKTSEVVKQNSDPVIRSGTGDCTPSKKKRRRSDSPIDFASIKSEMTPQLSTVSIRPNSQLIDASHPPKRTHDYIASLMKDGPVCRRTSTQPQRPLIQCWDLAGQSQYVMAHALFVKNGNLIVFVVNLKRLRDEETRLDEVRELCRWMQLVFALVQDTASLRPIIVGTHKDSCGDWGDAVKVLHKGLLDEVGEAVYNTWVRAGLETENGGEGRAISLVAVENRTSQDDPEESGIQELEQLIKQRSADILASRQEVPLRWIAFVEETERRRPVVLNKNDISNFVDGFPGFSTKKKEREQDALQALRHFNSHGRNVLFELSEEEFYVFPCPDVMLDFVRRVTGPEALVRERLSQKNERMLAKGLVTFGGLRALWHEHPKETCNVMCDVLCSVDILMRVQPADGTPVHSEDLIAIPALLPKAGNWLHCASRPGESEVRLVTEFVDAFPPGLMSCLISHLYKKVGRATAKVGLVGSNAAVLTARVELKETGRVVVSFVSQKRHIEWKVFAQDPVSVARTCVTAVEEFSSMPLRGKRFRMKHFLRTKCRLDLNGCGGEWTASFQLPGDWVENDTKARLPNLDGECASPCEEAWRLWELMPEIVEDCRPEASGMMQQSSKVVRMEAMDVFISHAGTDKSFIAGPVFHEVQKEGLNCFLDKARIEPGDTGSDEMTAAMESAKIGVFILSPEFAARRWTMRELRCFLCRRREARRTGVMPPTILPVFYRLSICECRDFKPEQYVDEKGKSLFEREKFYSAERQNEATMAMVKAELREITEITGIENMEWASNNVHDLLAHDYRERLVKRIVMWVRKKWGEYWQQERAV